MMGRFLDAGVSVTGAGLFSQFPAFYHHYLQRLGGRLDQARLQAERIEEAAGAEGMRVADYIEVFLKSSESAHRRQGGVMLQEMSDLERLRAALDALAGARPLERPLRFAEHMDPELAEATLQSFNPGLPLTPEGFVYAAAGLLTGLLLLAGGRRALSGLGRRRRSRA
ncbi:MAG: DUF2937 family protein [Kiloniellaceae bacterium]